VQRSTHLVRGGALACLTAVGALLVAGGDARARQPKRFGIEAEVLGYDEARKVLKVKVRETQVDGRFASGNTVGGKAPGDIKRRSEQEFAVEPEGSVLRRTVIKAMTGGGLDTSGTREGFKKALAQIPDDRPVVMSLEPNSREAIAAGAPRYKILMIQIPYTEEELIERWERLTVEEE
jgi:hypothetical protein